MGCNGSGGEEGGGWWQKRTKHVLQILTQKESTKHELLPRRSASELGVAEFARG